MDTRKIRKLIELVKETGIGELEVKSGDESVRINCQDHVVPAPAQPPAVAAPAPTPAPEQAHTHHPEPAAAPTETKKKGHDGHVVKSPMVGTVYLSPSPGSDPFVSIGQHIEAGDTLCIIEAMKMFNKIEADKSGVLSARLIDNETPVEYDQDLFIIETD